MIPRPGSLVVFVHGAWHSSAHWARTQRALAAHGVASVAADLPGHGPGAPVPPGYLEPGQPGLAFAKSALAGLTMQDNADAVLAVLADVRPRFRRVVLVAHSAGGGPASAAVEQEPGLVDHLVYVSSFVPAGRPRFADYLAAPENADAVSIPPVGDPAELGVLRINPLSPDPAVVAVVRESFLGDLPPDAPDSWRQLLQPDLPLAIPTAPVRVSARRWGRVPRAFVRLTGDRALPLAAQDLMITEADRVTPANPARVWSLPGGHSPFLVRPGALADVLAEIVAAEDPR